MSAARTGSANGVPAALASRCSAVAERPQSTAGGPAGEATVGAGAGAEAGAEDGIVKAERCVCNRNDQTATSDSAVSLTRKGLQITGVGFEWHAAGKRLKILSQARVELARPAITKERILERE